MDEAPKSGLDGRKAEGEEQHGRNESLILFIGHGGEREGGRGGVQDMAGRLLADPRPWLTGLSVTRSCTQNNSALVNFSLPVSRRPRLMAGRPPGRAIDRRRHPLTGADVLGRSGRCGGRCCRVASFWPGPTWPATSPA